MKLSFVGLAALVSVGAQASFELLTVVDSGTKSVHRFDGSTGNYLGSFGNGYFSNPNGIVLDTTNGLAYVSDVGLGLYRVFNYNTGQHVTDFPPGAVLGYFALGPSDTFMQGYFLGSFVRLFTSGVIANAINIQNVGGAAGASGHMARHSSGFYLGATYNGNATPSAALQTFQPTGANTIAKGPETTQMGNYFVQHMVALQGNRYSWSANGTIVHGQVASNGASIIQSGTYTQPGLFTGATTGIAYGHGNTLYHVGRNTANTSGIIVRGLHGSNQLSTPFGQGILQNPVQIQAVVAPEPGTMLALSAGLGLLLRRRRSRKSS